MNVCGDVALSTSERQVQRKLIREKMKLKRKKRQLKRQEAKKKRTQLSVVQTSTTTQMPTTFSHDDGSLVSPSLVPEVSSFNTTSISSQTYSMSKEIATTFSHRSEKQYPFASEQRYESFQQQPEQHLEDLQKQQNNIPYQQSLQGLKRFPTHLPVQQPQDSFHPSPFSNLPLQTQTSEISTQEEMFTWQKTNSFTVENDRTDGVSGGQQVEEDYWDTNKQYPRDVIENEEETVGEAEELGVIAAEEEEVAEESAEEDEAEEAEVEAEAEVDEEAEVEAELEDLEEEEEEEDDEDEEETTELLNEDSPTSSSKPVKPKVLIK